MSDLATSRFLSRGFEPIREEVDLADLRIEGDLPPGLEGTFYRIGPNPQFEPRGSYNPLMGDGMVHAFTLRGGRVAYRNRWVRTRRWRLENAAGRALFGTSHDPRDDDPSVAGEVLDGVANTNLVHHAGRLLALEEGAAPIEIDPVTLETLGPWTFAGRLPRNMTAHPKIDPATGEMIAFANFPAGRVTGHLAIYRIDPAGELIEASMIEGPCASLIHDFAVTTDFIVVAFCPSTISIKRVRAGLPAIAWEPALGAHVGVRRRDGGETRWWRAPAFMAWHYLNAFNEGRRITVDVCQQAAAMYPLADGTPPEEEGKTQQLVRWTLDWDAPGELALETLWDGPCEYPRIDERRTGRPHRLGWLACDGGPGTGDFHRGLARFDFETGELTRWSAGPTSAVGEPVFAARPGGAAEDDGYVLTTVFDEQRGESCLAVFRADALAAGPVARAHVGRRVPMGFHAIWVPAYSLFRSGETP